MERLEPWSPPLFGDQQRLALLGLAYGSQSSNNNNSNDDDDIDDDDDHIVMFKVLLIQT